MLKPILRKILSDRAGYIKQKVWKTKLGIFRKPYLENFRLTELGISNKKCGKHNLKYLKFLKI